MTPADFEKPDIKDIREGAADFAREHGLSRVEGACEVALLLANILHCVYSGSSLEDAVVIAAKDFEERWGIEA